MKIRTPIISMLVLMSFALATVPEPNARDHREDRADDKKVITEATMKQVHTFHSTDGKVVKGRILAYDPQSNSVTIAKGNKQTFDVSMELFSKADQAQVRDWHSLHAFFEKDGLRISIKRRGKGSIAEPLFWKPEQEIIYDITLMNRCGRQLENLTLEYGVYYNRQLLGQGDRGGELRVEGGVVKVGSIGPGEASRVGTRPVIIRTDDLYEYYKVERTPIGKLQGIRIRVYLPLENGKKAMREAAFPHSLMKNHKWIPPRRATTDRRTSDENNTNETIRGHCATRIDNRLGPRNRRTAA